MTPILIPFAGKQRDFRNTFSCLIAHRSDGKSYLEYDFDGAYFYEEFENSQQAHERRQEINKIILEAKSK